MTICERMFDLLESSNTKTAAELCRLLGITTSITSGWKKRNTDPPAKYITTIADYIGVSVMYLLTGEDDEKPEDDRLQLTDDERRLLTKYRCLDEDGRDAVRGVLLSEQRRVESEKGMAQSAAS